MTTGRSHCRAWPVWPQHSVESLLLVGQDGDIRGGVGHAGPAAKEMQMRQSVQGSAARDLGSRGGPAIPCRAHMHGKHGFWQQGKQAHSQHIAGLDLVPVKERLVALVHRASLNLAGTAGASARPARVGQVKACSKWHGSGTA